MYRNEGLATLASAVVLVIGMGFGRFAFTGLYPLMVADGQMSLEGGSYAASANYAGYLIGALLAAVPAGIPSRLLCAFAAITTAALMALLATPAPETLIVAIRGLAGVSSAIAMVAASHWLIHDRRHPQGAPILFAGVGAGILISAEIIALGRSAMLSSRAIWLALGLVALVLSIAAIAAQVAAERVSPKGDRPGPKEENDTRNPFGAIRLIVVYGLAGFGYIITATYLPLLVRSALGAVDPVHIWAVFGLDAVPSCFLWHMLSVRWGTGRSLMLNLRVQAIGVALPIFHNPFAYIASALLVGGTFMGTVTIVMPVARKAAAKARFNMLAILTASYGVGQIVGPLIANALYGTTASFDASLAIASLALLVATILCIGPAHVEGLPFVDKRGLR